MPFCQCCSSDSTTRPGKDVRPDSCLFGMYKDGSLQRNNEQEYHIGMLTFDELIGCGYLNGVCQVATAQFLLLAGMFLSLAAIGDCSFISVSPGIDASNSQGLVERVGLLTFQHPDGTCYFYTDSSNPWSEIQDYFNFLGRDWQVALVFGCIGAAGGIFYLVFSMCLCCCSHVKPVRLFNAFMLSVVLTIFQCLTLLVFASSLCDEYECTFSRSSGWSVGAAFCFASSGICHMLMNDYPGPRSPPRKKDDEPDDEEKIYLVPTPQEQAPGEEILVEEEEAKMEDEQVNKRSNYEINHESRTTLSTTTTAMTESNHLKENPSIVSASVLTENAIRSILSIETDESNGDEEVDDARDVGPAAETQSEEELNTDISGTAAANGEAASTQKGNPEDDTANKEGTDTRRGINEVEDYDGSFAGET